MPHIVVERTFDAPLTDADIQAAIARLTPCAKIYNVTWVRSFLSPDKRRMICEYEAADAESVRTVQREASTPFDNAWTAELIEPGA